MGVCTSIHSTPRLVKEASVDIDYEEASTRYNTPVEKHKQMFRQLKYVDGLDEIDLHCVQRVIVGLCQSHDISFDEALYDTLNESSNTAYVRATWTKHCVG